MRQWWDPLQLRTSLFPKGALVASQIRTRNITMIARTGAGRERLSPLWVINVIIIRKSDEIEGSGEPEALMAVPFVDLGVNAISDYFAKMTKYLRQPYENRPLSNPSGPWECAQTKEFDENPYFQEKIVKLFGRPSTTSFRVRKLPTDDKENISTLDKCADVLNVFPQTHEQTGMNMPVGQASEVWIPGDNANRVADRMLFGDIGGGLCGQHTLLLWKINGDDSVHAESIMMDPDIRSLLTHLGQLHHGVENNLC